MTVSCLRVSGRVLARRDGELGELSGRGAAPAAGVLGNAIGGRVRRRRSCVYDAIGDFSLFDAGDVESGQVQCATGQVLRGRRYRKVGAYQLGRRGRSFLRSRMD